MKIKSIKPILGGVSVVAMFLAAVSAEAIQYSLGIGNSAISGYTGPYATADVTLTDSTHAKIVFTSLTGGGNIFLLGDGGSVAVNVNATSWTLGNTTGANSGTGFTPGSYSDGGAGNEDGFGSFNQTINSFDGYTHSSSTITLLLTDDSGTWASASDVLAKNASGYYVGAHIFVTSEPANANNGALATGFAVDGSTGGGGGGGGGGGVPDGGSTIALLGFGLVGIDYLRRRIAKA